MNGVAYNFQAFARNTIFNAGRDYSAVQSLNSLLVENAIPAGGVARALLEAGYKSASGSPAPPARRSRQTPHSTTSGASISSPCASASGRR